ncbi:MAG TPA: phosphoenolpyruvate--protein phosphotransferase [Candidatus Saccharimonadales bacterium]|nr:phosphoenolpyruvate--protein phosphotransferase [Candidatus Saccharimonadales bacterium]
MTSEFTFLCPLAHGIHARPASHLANLANRFAATCVLTNLRTGAVADGKSVLSIIAAGVGLHDECRIHLRGADEQVACEALQRFIETDLPGCDAPLLELADGHHSQRLPHALQGAGLKAHFGTPVGRGVGQGRVVVIGGVSLPPELNDQPSAQPEWEQARATSAMTAISARIQKKLTGHLPPLEKALLQAHLAILGDIQMRDKLAELILQGRSAGQAVIEAGTYFSNLLQQSGSSYIGERALDVQDICFDLLEEIYGVQVQATPQLHGPSVIVTGSLRPQQLLALDRKRMQALVLEAAGTTSHAMILARSLGIPAVVGIKDAVRSFRTGEEVIVDANRGFALPGGAAPVRRFYEHEENMMRRRQASLARYAMAPAVTSDGHRIEVGANVSSTAELGPAFENGADGIGLYRTEMLFAVRDHAPSEEEQFTAYVQAVQAAGGKPVILRTVDIGGDKPVAYLELPAEENPFLGYRGVRIYAEHPKLIRTQMRAMLRASAFGRVQMMAPMVSSVGEVRWMRAQLGAIREELTAANIAFDASMPLGIMIEVPSAGFLIGPLCREADFFSLGTNDLLQYFFAADRTHAKVSGLASGRNPGFLAFLKQIVEGAHRHGKWVGMCGEMAADLVNLPLLIGLGLDEISVSGSEIPVIKERIAGLSFAHCQELLAQAMASQDATECEALLRQPNPGGADRASVSLLERELIVLDSQSASKEEAVREIVSMFFVQGRTQDADLMEEAIWARESVYSTGLGYGFAIPHCKTDSVSSNAIGILKLQQPVEWGSLDGEPVRMVVLLAARESDTNGLHLQVFSRLARNLMEEEFRERLMRAERPEEVVEYLRRELEIPE